MTTAIAPSVVANPFDTLNQTTAAAKVGDTSTATADRFLTMLVTQLQNQDPLNPMDNAQITSQMAQINAVTGLEKVNESVKSLGSQILQMQALQGAALIGRDVMVEGDSISLRDGVGRGAVEFDSAATAARVEVLDSNNRVVGSVDLGARPAGRHSFEWSSGSQPADASYHFRVIATQDKTAVTGRTLELDRVRSVSTAGDQLTLSLSGTRTVAMSDVVAFN